MKNSMRSSWRRAAYILGLGAAATAALLLAPQEAANAGDIKIRGYAHTHGGKYYSGSRGRTTTSFNFNLYGMGMGGYDYGYRDGRDGWTQRQGVRYDDYGNAYGYKSEGYAHRPRHDRPRHHGHTELRQTEDGRNYCTNGGRVTLRSSTFGSYYECTF